MLALHHHSPTISAWPIASGTQAIIVGGTFDPPHAGHIELSRSVRDALAPQACLIFVPAHRSPFKGGEQTDASHRAAMLRLAISTLPAAAVWTDEIDRAAINPGAPSYTVDTLTRATQVGPQRLWLLLGADQVAQLHRWREPRRVLELATPIVLLRPPLETSAKLREAMAGVMVEGATAPDAMSTAAARFWTQTELNRWTREAISIDPRFAPISSTSIRAIIADRGVNSVPQGWLAPQVAAYISEHRLYERGVAGSPPVAPVIG